ncbi:hypothetical protein ACRARG_01605 [Pseudooceanicola sp. C21-150M6]|uniref:hypothetical protein n=1 Tax=Pseudooceanicola sp. C21-150M6 TaxID=3434355 RepID=UPI003D7F9B67
MGDQLALADLPDTATFLNLHTNQVAGTGRLNSGSDVEIRKITLVFAPDDGLSALCAAPKDDAQHRLLPQLIHRITLNKQTAPENSQSCIDATNFVSRFILNVAI